MDEDTLDVLRRIFDANEIAKIEAESGSSMVIISPMDKARRRIARQQRQITRLRESVSYRLGRHVTIAIEKPWRIPFYLSHFDFPSITRTRKIRKETRKSSKLIIRRIRN